MSEKHEAMINVNVVTFMKCFYHYMKIFAAQDRGAVINVSSMTGISSSPWNGQYGAGKAFILKMTEAVACETEKTNVDVEVITLGTTLTPSLLSNLPGGPQGEAVMKTAQTPEEVVDEAFEKLGKEKIYSHAEEIAKTTFVNAIIGIFGFSVESLETEYQLCVKHIIALIFISFEVL